MVSYLCKGDSSIFILVHFFYNLVSFLLRYEEPSTLYNPLKFVPSNHAVIVQIEGVKGFINVEIRHSTKSLPNRLCSDLRLEVGAPDGAELDLCVREEAVITAVKRVAMIRWASIHHGCIVRVLGKECFRELS